MTSRYRLKQMTLVCSLGLSLFPVACKKSEPDTAPPAQEEIEASTASTTRTGHTEPPDVTPPDPKVVSGVDAYKIGMCAKCHGRAGKGGPRAPDLTDDQWDHCDGTPEGIMAVLTQGVQREKMKDPERPFPMNPATNLIKDDAVITVLAEYVASLSATATQSP